MDHLSVDWLFRASWQASLLCLLVLAAQWLLGRRLGAVWRCNLWLLVACRFLLPFSVQSPFVLFNLTARVPILSSRTHVLSGNREASISEKTAARLSAESNEPGRDSQAVTFVERVRQDPPTVSHRIAQLWSLLPMLWLVGAGSLAIWMAACSAWFRWRLRSANEIQDTPVTSLLAQCAKEMHVRRCVRLFESSAVGSPALHGLWHPRILMPPGMSARMDTSQLRFVFLHELAHVKRWDVATCWLMTAAQVSHWFNPLAWLAGRRLRIERELASDALVLHRAGAGERKPYGETILRLLQEIRQPTFAPGMLGVLRDGDGMRSRMKLIADFTPSTSRGIWPVMLLATLTVVGLVNPMPMRGAYLEALAGSLGWQKLATADLLGGRSSSSTVWTGTELIVFGGEGMEESFGDGARFDLAENKWRPLLAQGSPASRTQHSAVWTGTEMIVWGGFGGIRGIDTNRNDGARFDPISNTWKPMTTELAPTARFQHTAVWTGREMLIWGGYTDSHALYQGAHNDAYLNSGGGYSPATDSWRELSRQGAPSARFNHAALWTGNRMIIWGGCDSRRALNDGGVYDPATDSWTPISTDGAPSLRKQPLAVWTGSEMIVWGGDSRDDRVFFQDGARYNPSTRRWTSISTNAAPVGRNFANAVWTGSKMMFWGGVNDEIGDTGYLPFAPGQLDGSNRNRYLNSGAAYDPVADSWTPTTTVNCPSARSTAAVWTGSGLLIFGGFNGAHLNDAYYFSP